MTIAAMSQGKNCYKLNEVNFSAGVPGYVARANKLGYRTVAGASGTTANILQYALVRAPLVVIELPSDGHDGGTISCAVYVSDIVHACELFHHSARCSDSPTRRWF